MGTVQHKKRARPGNFNNVWYYAVGLLVISILGFWPSYFSKFLNGTADFGFYFHFHLAMALLWIGLLIVQPVLIKKRKLEIHRQLGKLSFIALPLLIVSVILLKHSITTPDHIKGLGASLWFVIKHTIILVTMFTIAMRYRHHMQIHARAMIATGIEFLEPGLGRFMINIVLPEPDFLFGLGISAALMYLLMIYMIIREREQKSGRWVFPLLLVMSLVFHILIFRNISFGALDVFATWFYRLPIT